MASYALRSEESGEDGDSLMSTPWMYAIMISLLFALFNAARADVSWTQDTRTELVLEDRVIEKDPYKTMIKLKQGGVRIKDADEGLIRLCNFSARSCVLYYPDRDAFKVLSVAELIRMAMDKIREHEHLLRRAMADSSGMPLKDIEALRAELESMEVRRLARIQSFEYKATDLLAEIEGIVCRKYVSNAGGQVNIEAWIAEDAPPDTAFIEYSRFLATTDPFNYRYYIHMPGFPMKIVASYGRMKITTLVTQISLDRITVSGFLLPESTEEIPSQ
jgi:hypothetical protein